MLVDFETYMILNEVSGRCNQLRPNGTLCHIPTMIALHALPFFEDKNGMCFSHSLQNRAFEFERDAAKIKSKASPKPKRVNMNTLSFHIAQAVFEWSGPGGWKVSTQGIIRWIMETKHYAPKKNLFKRRLREMVERGELVRVKLSYRLTPNYRKKFKNYYPVKNLESD